MTRCVNVKWNHDQKVDTEKKSFFSSFLSSISCAERVFFKPLKFYFQRVEFLFLINISRSKICSSLYQCTLSLDFFFFRKEHFIWSNQPKENGDKTKCGEIVCSPQLTSKMSIESSKWTVWCFGCTCEHIHIKWTNSMVFSSPAFSF